MLNYVDKYNTRRRWLRIGMRKLRESLNFLNGECGQELGIPCIYTRTLIASNTKLIGQAIK